MSRQTNSGDGYPADLLVDVRAGNVRSLRERLENTLRSAVQDGRLVPGAVLSPSRTLAAELAISRSVVVEAYANLTADGYLEARQAAKPGCEPSQVLASQPAAPPAALPAQ